MILGKRIGYLIDIILVFVFFYAIVFVGIPFASSKFVLLFLILVSARQYIINEFVNNTFIKYCLCVWIAFSIYYFGATVFAGEYNFGFLQQTFWFFVEGIFFTYLLYIYLVRKYTKIQILYLLVNVFLLQSLFVILCFLSTDLRELIDSILVINDERYISSTRMKGFANSGGAGLSYLQSMGVFVACSLVLTEKKRKNIYFLLLAIITIASSQIFIARTGLLFSTLIIGGAMLQYSINKGSLFNFFKQIFGVILIVILLLNTYLFFIPSDRVETFNERVLGRAFEFYENYERTGQFETNSTTALQDMYILPDSDLKVLFGAGIWDDPPGTRKFYKRQVDSDVGYVRLIYAVGILGSFIFYSIYYIYLKFLFKSDLNQFFKIGILCLFVIFILGELKEPFLVRSSGIIKSLCLILFVYVAKPYKKNVTSAYE